jgi:hypothetical protein
MAKYPEFFPSFTPGDVDYSPYGDGTCDFYERDAWGYEWHYTMHGLEGCTVRHPLESWDALASYRPPDGDYLQDRGGIRDWGRIYASVARKKREGKLTSGSLTHGFLFLRMQYLRGFENLMVDMAEDEPRLFDLIGLIDRENFKVVRHCCRAGVDVMELPEDLGAESSMVISRAMFQKYVLPSYRRMIAPCRESGAKVEIHSDGYILDILDDLIEVGMDIINPQDLCNGVDNLARALKGRVCIRLDLDRVKITPHGTRSEIFELIEHEVKTLGSWEGGLEFIYGIYPPTGPGWADAAAPLLGLLDGRIGYQRMTWM